MKQTVMYMQIFARKMKKFNLEKYYGLFLETQIHKISFFGVAIALISKIFYLNFSKLPKINDQFVFMVLEKIFNLTSRDIVKNKN